MSIHKYNKYAPVDFLKDDDFIRWQLFHSEEDSLFWINLIHEYPNIKPCIEEAIAQYKNNIRLNDFRLTPAEISDNLTSLKSLINKNKKRKSKYVLLQRAIAVACIITIAILIPFLLYNKESVQDITSFVETLPEPDLNSSDTKLILSDKSIIDLRNEESSIQYDEETVKIDDDLIRKENSNSYNQLITPYGKRAIITFSDGTKAWVNAGTKLVYPTEFSKGKREIYVDGEIYIEVSKDIKRPFVVKTKDIDIKVLGTKFNVSAYQSDKERTVVLVSGSVSISSKTQSRSVLLEPDQMYFNIEDSYTIKNVDASIYTLWTKGLYQFESEKLRNILNRLERYYGVRIECDDSIVELRCSGKLDLKDNLNKLLTELTGALPIVYKQKSDRNYVINIK